MVVNQTILFTNSQWETANPGTDLYQNDYTENDLLYVGANGANQNITRVTHIVEGS